MATGKQPPMMTPRHPRWEEFCARLEGPEACDFKEKVPGDPDSVTWKCKGGRDKTFAIAILKDMGFDVNESLGYFDSHGGHCDCEILFNVQPMETT